MQIKLQLLHQFLNEITHLSSEDELIRLFESYKEQMHISSDDKGMYQLLLDAKAFGREMLLLKASYADPSHNRKLASLSAEEKEELAEALRIIDENRFCYHFQPIVNTQDGGIYSYEALMPPKSEMRLSPFHILKYAELTARLNEIELATFLNVLHIIDTQKAKFKGRRVFINSIPKIMLNGTDFRRVGELLLKHSDTAVVELTEYAESDEADLNVLKERYRNLGIKIAIDDYGTGYSNVNNLLRYMPDYVKIDRSLITDIQNNPKKRHFVREIIEFCHGNGIMALAEGVETSEELRQVILMGVDLIQGYYTAKPDAQVIDEIPYEIRQEIRLCQQERQDGRDQQVYVAETHDRILLDKIARDGYKCILVKGNDSDDNNVTIIGLPSLDTEIHIEVAKDFKGRIILENVHLSNVKNRPCIDLSENADVTLCLCGENKLNKSGIRVPESARLTLEGEGLLDISVDAAEYFGIGNDASSVHGEILFRQAGLVNIIARGRNGICIGSGLGGSISFGKGKCVLHVNGYTGVGIGSLYDETRIDISNCAIDADISLRKGVAIGSMTGNTSVQSWRSSVQLTMSVEESVAIGTLGGEHAEVQINDAITVIDIKARDRCACIGSLDAATTCKIENAALRATASGERALPFGGLGGDTRVLLLNADANVRMETDADLEAYISADHLRITGGNTTFTNRGERLPLITSG